jgi:hypothetical protein
MGPSFCNTNDHCFRLTAYTMTASKEPRRASILCPYAIGFDRPLRAMRAAGR